MGCKVLEKQKKKHKKGLWSPDEDSRLKNYILQHGFGCWSSVPTNTGLQRNGKSCRLRWINYLRPGLKRGVFTAQEEETILKLHGLLGNKWSHIAQRLPGRTDNEIKNFWHSCLKKKIAKQEQDDHQSHTIVSQITSLNNKNNTESTTSSLNSTPTSSLNPFEVTERSLLHITNNSFPESSNVPKVLFTEWLSLDQFQRQDSIGSSCQQKESCGNSSSPPDFPLDDFEGAFCDDFQKGILNNGIGDEMLIRPQYMSKAWFQESGFGSFNSDQDIMNGHIFLNNDTNLYNL